MDDAVIVIAPGTNTILNFVARQMENLPDVRVLLSANDVLWQARQTPPRTVLTDLRLSDMSALELAEILPNFAPDTRIIVCAAPGEEANVRAAGAEFVAFSGTSADDVAAVYRALDLVPPATLPGTAALNAAPPAPTQAPAQQVVAPARPAVPPAAKPSATPAAKVAPVPQTAPKPVAATPKPAPAPPSNGGFNGDGAIVIQPQQNQMLRSMLDTIAKEVGAQCVLLIDPAGMVLMQSGALSNVAMPLIGPLLATSFSSASQLARQLHEQGANATYIHEGDLFDIYAFNVSYRVSLVILFDRKVNPGKLGTVWVYAKRAMRQLQQILKL